MNSYQDGIGVFFDVFFKKDSHLNAVEKLLDNNPKHPRVLTTKLKKNKQK